MNRLSISTVLMILLVVAGMSVPAMAVGSNSALSNTGGGTAAAMTAQQNDTQNDSSVEVTAGQQLATVISVSSDDIHIGVENTAFELSVEGADDEAQAEAIADRAEALRDRAETIREDYEAATEAYEDGEITKSEYAQRLASLNARASNLLSSYERLGHRAANVSGLELRAAGANLSSLDAAIENLSSVTGPGSSALLAQYLGEADGEIKLETADGIKIEIEREDGESSREFERARDDDSNITVDHAAALRTARDALSTPDSGHWVLTESKVKSLEGALEFEFVLAGSERLTGEAEVRVDGSTGEVYRLEQETERRGDDDDDAHENEREHEEEDEDDEHDELTLLVAEGTPGPNATITLRVLAAGTPAEGVTVSLNDHEIGATDANGTITVTLPASGDAELTAEAGEAEGRLKLEFEDEHDSAAVFEHLAVSASLDGDAVTVDVRFDGAPVRNATVYANDHRVGRTDAEGTVMFAFDANASDELELEVVKGQFEAELAFELRHGSLVLTEAEHEGDGDKAEREHESDHEDDYRTLEMAVIHGTAAPGATVTIQVLAGGEPVEGATVTLDGDVVGTTDANGTIEVTLLDEDDADLRAEHGDADGRLEFEFDEDEETEDREG